ncbi:tripartite tricarboxylate transporter TctB family protein [Nitratireductor aquimarinus]|uniref:tripartite tricarboxylate transporter TctB family protein n=1 Tax=Nitratireductor TaxID=245876 RepID=UPI0019D37952|nr:MULTISPECIES: tripartite tricarboxylate transporter TctB family protein [Nitratireductor]MBN7776422.1 tripartite tricarboxylate transporter TctB family protein [Nitratireductor pacificus]MBN7779289.1 tripartite tricarboxylate transporter TctB family protein [Nitratireductor pacificus]MBN7788096.1 tripartite tricarboxylate transporter TctB family protein [Nitratireductor aquimarinus]MBY6098143.1 tripartite tricarboxylate transporter TctB family protein [Nitratireductor aquimarinus]MCA1259474
MNSDIQGKRVSRLPQLRKALGELIVVGGASLVMIFWIIPAQTSSGGELGLSPQLVPTVCSIVIGLLTLFRFIATLISTPVPEPGDDAPIHYALSMIAATVAGIAAIAYLGWVIGGAILALLVLLVLAERRPLMLVGLPVSIAVLLFLIQKTGI